MSEQLSKVAPVLVMLAVLVLATALGAVWGSTSVEIVSTGPWQLEKSYQGIYVQAAADAYALDNNQALAIERLSYLCQQDNGLVAALDEASARYGADPAKADNLSGLRNLVDGGQVAPNDAVQVCNLKTINPRASLMRLLAPILIVLMGLGIIGWGVMLMVRESEDEALQPARESEAVVAAAKTVEKEKEEEAKEDVALKERSRATRPGLSLPFGRREKEPVEKSAAARGAELSAAAAKTDFKVEGGDPPVVQFMTTYLHGDELYDDSFSIEAPSGEFLGECGVGISDTISKETGKQVSAFEVWLFDKNDIRTITKVVMSELAFTDEEIRSKLAAKGEAVMAKPDGRFELETMTLRVVVRVVDMAYGSGPPANGYFDRVTLELATWKRDEKKETPPSAEPPSAPRGAPPTSGTPSPPPGRGAPPAPPSGPRGAPPEAGKLP